MYVCVCVCVPCVLCVCMCMLGRKPDLGGEFFVLQLKHCQQAERRRNPRRKFHTPNIRNCLFSMFFFFWRRMLGFFEILRKSPQHLCIDFKHRSGFPRISARLPRKARPKHSKHPRVKFPSDASHRGATSHTSRYVYSHVSDYPFVFLKLTRFGAKVG